MLATFCCFLVGNIVQSTAPAEPVRLSYGMLPVGQQQAAVSFPRASLEAPASRVVEFEGRSYFIGNDGSLGLGQTADGGWGEFARQYANLGATPPPGQPWKLKVYLLTRTEFLTRNNPGGVRLRHGSIESFQLPSIYESLARFSAMVRGTTGGRVAPQIDLEIDDDAERSELTADGERAMGAEFANRTIGPRINTKAFDTDDGVDRGPWHGIFVIHAGLVDPVPLTEVRGIPTSLISFYPRSVLADGDRLALSLYASWIRQLSFRANQAGYHVPQLNRPFDNPFNTRPDRFMFPGMWSSVLDLGRAAGPDYLTRKFRPSTAIAAKWTEVADDPWAKLPRLTSDLVNAYFSGQAPALTSLLAGDTDQSVFGKDLVAVPAERAALIGSLTSATFEPSVIGFLEGSQRNAVLFRLKQLPSGPAEINLIAGNIEALKPGATMADGSAVTTESNGVAVSGDRWFYTGDPSKVTTGSGATSKPVAVLPEVLRTEGTLRAERGTDPDMGASVEISERGFFRSGVVEIHRAEIGTHIDIAANPIISFKFRQSGRDGYALRLSMENGRRGYVVLHREPFVPVQVIDQNEPWVVSPLETVNKWQTFGVDLSPLIDRLGSSHLVAVSVTPVPYYEYFERQQIDAATAAITPVTFSSDRNLVVAPSGPPEQEVEARLQRLVTFPDTPTDEDLVFLREQLNDPYRRIQATALTVLSRLKAPGEVGEIVDLLKSTNPSVAILAAQALAFQDTPEAWAALRRAVEIGPFDHTRFAAIRVVMNRKDSAFAGSISLLYASKSWRVREMAVRALGAMKSREASVVAMTFLREADPCVRLAVVQSSDISQDIVARRMLYVAVNDPSEVVRATAAIRLIAQGAGELLAEALKTVRDESPYVRGAILEHLAANPQPDARALVRSALGDPDPIVRGDAVSALGALAQAPDVEEWRPLFAELDPRVHASVVAVFTARKWALPAELRKCLLSSRDPAVASAAEKLP